MFFLVRTTALLARRGVFLASLALILIVFGTVPSTARSASSLVRSTPHFPSALAASSASVEQILLGNHSAISEWKVPIGNLVGIELEVQSFTHYYLLYYYLVGK